MTSEMNNDGVVMDDDDNPVCIFCPIHQGEFAVVDINEVSGRSKVAVEVKSECGHRFILRAAFSFTKEGRKTYIDIFSSHTH